MLYIDTRQQAGKHDHVDRWLDAHGVAYEYRKLDFGDYMVDGEAQTIDTNTDVKELADNQGHDHALPPRDREGVGGRVPARRARRGAPGVRGTPTAQVLAQPGLPWVPKVRPP